MSSQVQRAVESLDELNKIARRLREQVQSNLQALTKLDRALQEVGDTARLTAVQGLRADIVALYNKGLEDLGKLEQLAASQRSRITGEAAPAISGSFGGSSLPGSPAGALGSASSPAGALGGLGALTEPQQDPGALDGGQGADAAAGELGAEPGQEGGLLTDLQAVQGQLTSALTGLVGNGPAPVGESHTTAGEGAAFMGNVVGAAAAAGVFAAGGGHLAAAGALALGRAISKPARMVGDTAETIEGAINGTGFDLQSRAVDKAYAREAARKERASKDVQDVLLDYTNRRKESIAANVQQLYDNTAKWRLAMRPIVKTVLATPIVVASSFRYAGHTKNLLAKWGSKEGRQALVTMGAYALTDNLLKSAIKPTT